MNTIEIEWAIKGYHAFKVKPDVGINLPVEMEAARLRPLPRPDMTVND
jgi:hypothetical protein